MSKPRLLIVSSAPASELAFDGFAARLAALETVLSTGWDVCRTSIIERAAEHDNFAVSRDLAFEGRTIRARFRRLASPQPSSVERVIGWDEVVRRVSPQLVLVHMPDVAHLAFQVPPTIPVVALFEENLFLHREHAVRTASPTMLRRASLRLDRLKTKHQIRRLRTRAALLAMISSDEADQLAAFAGIRDVIVVPHGIQRGWISHGSPGKTTPTDVLVVGRFDHSRNAEPLRALMEESHAISPELKWSFVGVGAANLRFARHMNAEVVDSVPDVRPFYRSARVAVVAPSFGSGVKTTLLQAWAAGVPVVSNPLGIAGTSARNESEALLGEHPAELALAVRRLAFDDVLRAKLASNGRRIVTNNHDVDKIMSSFSQEIERVTRGGRG